MTDNQILLEVARLVSRQSLLLVAMAGMMLMGLILLSFQLRLIAVDIRSLCMQQHQSRWRVAEMTAALDQALARCRRGGSPPYTGDEDTPRDGA
jgi:hypothetical protein